MIEKNRQNLSWLLLFCAWIIAVIEMLGSLFFGEVMAFLPCNLFSFPMVEQNK